MLPKTELEINLLLHSDKKTDIAKVDSSNTVISRHKVIVFEHWSANDNTNLVIQTRMTSLHFVDCRISTKIIFRNKRQDWQIHTTEQRHQLAQRSQSVLG